MVVLDTNIVVDHLRQRSAGDTMLQSLLKHSLKEDVAISLITVQELYEGKSTRNRIEEEALLTTFSLLRILPYTFDVAQKAGEIARDLGRPIELSDAAIAATAILNEALLLTLNQKDFRDIESLDLMKL